MQAEVPQTLQVSDAAEIHRLLGESTGVVPVWSESQVVDVVRQHSAFGLRDAGGIAAFVLFRELPGAREILHLATAVRVRRQGYMVRLLRFLRDGLKPGEALWLEVHEGNHAARALYEKLGFREVGRRPRYYSDSGAAILYNLG